MNLKRNIKFLSLALTAVLAFSAIAAVAAQATAPRWTVVGVVNTTITAQQKETLTGFNTGAVALSIPALGVQLTSTNDKDCTIGGDIIGSGAGAPGTFTGHDPTLTCKNVETNSPDCTVSTENELVHGLVASERLKATLVWLVEKGDEKVGLLFESDNANNTLAKVLITGHAVDKCPISGTYNITGCMIAEVEPVTQDVTTAKLTLPAGAIKNYWTNQTPTRTKDICAGLKFGANPATITGTFDAHLNSDKLYGVEPG